MGGFDGTKMVSSTEIFDPRLCLWVDGVPMNQARGYSAAAVVDESIYVIGGVRSDEHIVDTVCITFDYTFFVCPDVGVSVSISDFNPKFY